MISRKVFSLAAAALAMTATPASAISPDQLLTGGGAIGYVVLGLSVVGIALIIEHFVSVQREKMAPEGLIMELQECLNEGQEQEALDMCEAEPGFFTNVMAAALPKKDHGYDSMEQAAHDIAQEEAIKLHAKISWLNLLAAIAPMLGLLGTVWGMVGAFGVIEKETAPDPSKFAGHISLALITTVLGLIVAIPMMVGYFYFRNKVTRIVLEIGAITEDLLDRYRHLDV